MNVRRNVQKPSTQSRVASGMAHTGHMKPLKKITASVVAAAALSLGLGATAQAADYSLMNGAELEQAVLRAQMPRTLGAWTQNYYFSGKEKSLTVPTVCWNAQGNVNLPAGMNMGAVGYAIDANTNGSVTIYQYANADKAKAALAALQAAKCADSPTVTDDGGKKVQGQSGSDFTDASQTGLGAGLSYTQDDYILFTQLNTTQRGLAVVQTQVFKAIPKSSSNDQQMHVANKLGSVGKAWHKNVLASYDAFGQGNSR